MKKQIFAWSAICLVVLISVCTKNEGVDFSKTKFADVLVKAQTEGKLVLLDFFSPT